MSQANANSGVIDLDLIASKALNLHRQYDRIKRQLDEHKQTLRDTVPEYPHTITVEGDGKVLVKTPPQQRTVKELKLNTNKWDEISDELKQQIIDSGLVEIEQKTKGGGLAAVEIKPNV